MWLRYYDSSSSYGDHGRVSLSRIVRIYTRAASGGFNVEAVVTEGDSIVTCKLTASVLATEDEALATIDDLLLNGS